MNYMPNENTEIYYLFGANMTELLEEVGEKEDMELITDFDNPDIHAECGGVIEWEDEEDVTSLESKGHCTRCGKEVILNE